MTVCEHSWRYSPHCCAHYAAFVTGVPFWTLCLPHFPTPYCMSPPCSTTTPTTPHPYFLLPTPHTHTHTPHLHPTPHPVCGLGHTMCAVVTGRQGWWRCLADHTHTPHRCVVGAQMGYHTALVTACYSGLPSNWTLRDGLRGGSDSTSPFVL